MNVKLMLKQTVPTTYQLISLSDGANDVIGRQTGRYIFVTSRESHYFCIEFDIKGQ